MPSIESVNLVRERPGPWGFRLQGGLDFEKALSVVFVTEGSFSHSSGLKTGDVILNIGQLEAALLTHKQAQDAIIKHGNSVPLTVQRNGETAETVAPGTWRPDVQIVGGPATGPCAPGQVYTKTSLTLGPKPEEEHWDVKHNITAKGFNSAGNSSQDIRSVQPPSAAPGVPAPSAQGFRSVSAPISKPGGPVAAPTGPPQPQQCWICRNPISGVFLQVKGRPLHGECFNCATCKCTLKNVGHFAIGEKLYCQLHAKEAQNAIHGLSESTVAPPAPSTPIACTAPSGNVPPGLAQNLARLSIRPQGMSLNNVTQMPPPPPPSAASADWSGRLNSNSAAMAGNAEDFTKEFMKQLTGSGV